jgi:type II secretory pathway pseudopilin PulG
MSGKRVIKALVVILLATAVLPPAAAWVVNRRRVDRASADIAEIVEQLKHAPTAWQDLARGTDVLCGPGRLPIAIAPETRAWVAAPRGSRSLADVLDAAHAPRSDPWGNCYLVNIGAVVAREPSVLWVISAGPNGIIDTPFLSSTLATPAGDDIGGRLR